MLRIYSLLQNRFRAMKIPWLSILVRAVEKNSVKKPIRLLTSFVFIFLTSNQQAVAQWSSDPALNTAISTAGGAQLDPRIASDGAGGAIITWYDDRNGNPDIYAQRINAGGAVEWAADGVAICTAALDQAVPKIVSDGAGGAIIIWQDFRNGSSDMYAQRVNAAGVVQWAINGVAISTAAGDQNFARMISDGEGGAIISWQDSRSGNADIYAQRINNNGAAEWEVNGVAISVVPASDQSSLAIVSDAAGGAVITWDDTRNGNDDIYAQRVNTTGAVLWLVNGVGISTAAGNQYDPAIVPAAAGGAIITWEDARTGNNDIYAQLVTATGDVQWIGDGVVICSAAGIQSNPAMISDDAGGAIITWEDVRNADGDIYAQRINTAGVTLWAVDGVPVTTAATGQYLPGMVTDSAGGAIISWRDFRNGDYDIYAQRVNNAGAVVWAQDDVAICTATGYQNEPEILPDGKGGAIITWYDYRAGNSDIYAQNINPSGTLGCVPPVITAWPQAEQTVCKNSAATQLTATVTGDNLTYQWYADNDNTGYDGAAISGETGSSFTAPSTTAGIFYYYVVVSNACGTAASAYSTVTVQPSKVWYQDSDKDGYGNALVIQMACTQPGGYVSEAGDCNDADEDIHPGATEVCNGIDDDCDGYVDEGFTKKSYYKDEDRDGYGDPKKCITTCDKCPTGYVPNNKDCNDHDKTIYPGAPELCDDKDNDCDDKVDEGLTKKSYYKDEDGDGYGDPKKCLTTCDKCPKGYVTNNKDCDDHDKSIYPGAKEICDNKDNDCDGQVDEGFTKKSYYKDADKDGYGDPKECIVTGGPCPSGYVTNYKDCNDKDKTIYTGAREICDGKDNNCDGRIDEGFTTKKYYKDADKDGYGDPKECIITCGPCPTGYVTNNKDCNDSKKSVHPGTAEIAANQIDDNCNGKVDEKDALARGGNDEEAVANEPERPLNEYSLKVNVFPNPSAGYFTLTLKGSSNEPVQLRVADITGRLLETKEKIAAHSTLTIGHNYRPGVYLVEVMQGSERVVIKCIKQ